MTRLASALLAELDAAIWHQSQSPIQGLDRLGRTSDGAS